MKRKAPTPPTAENTLHFEVIAEPFRELLTAIPTFVEREDHVLLRANPDFREFLTFQLQAQAWFYRLVAFAAATGPPDPHRHPEFVAVLFPILRSQLELLMTLMYLMDMHPARFEHFKKAGWKKAQENLRRDEREYGSDVSMAGYLDGERQFLEIAEAKAHLTADELQGRKKIGRWLNPGQFKNDVQPDLQRVFGKLDHWLYDELSRAAHFNMLGTLDVGVVLKTLRESHGEEWEIWVARHRSVVGFRSLGLVLATFSEVEMMFRFRTRDKLMVVWELAAEKIPFIKDLYDLRWRDGLQGIT